jgi:tetratricopeptide (TPR) repeat protein
MVTQLTRVLTAGLLLVPAVVRADKKIDDTVAKAIGQLEKNRDAKDEPLKNADKLAKDPGAESQLGAARIYVAVGKLDEAKKAAAKAVEVSASGTPELRAQALSYLSAVELRAGAGKDALAHAQEAAKLSQLPEILANLANAQSRVSDPSALKTSEDLVKAAPTSAAAHSAHGTALAASGKYDEAIAELTKALELDPKDYNTQVAKARVLVDAGRGADAEIEAKKATTLDPNQGEGFAVLGAAMLLKDPSSASAAVNEAVNGSFLTPGSAYIQYTVGRIHEAAGNIGPAGTAYEAAKTIDPSLAKAQARLIQMKLWKGDVAGAATEAQQLAENQPNDGDAQLVYGRILLRNKKDFASAIVPLERAVQRLPNDADAHSLLGEAYTANRQSQDALDQFKRATELNPASPEIARSYGMLLGLNKQAAQGIAVLEKLVRTPGYKDPLGYVALGLLYKNVEPARPADSVAAYKKAIELDPKNISAQLGLAWALHSAKNWPEAIAAFEKTATLEPKLAGEANLGSAWSQYFATVEAKSKDMAKTQEAYAKAKATLPASDPRPARLLSSIERYLKAGQAEDKPVKVERQAAEEKPDLGAVVRQAAGSAGSARAAAVRSLGGFGAEAVQYLVPYLSDSSLRVRTSAAKALGAVGAPAASAVRFLQDQGDKSRERVMLPPAGVKVTAEDMMAERELQDACQEAVRKINGK